MLKNEIKFYTISNEIIQALVNTNKKVVDARAKNEVCNSRLFK